MLIVSNRCDRLEHMREMRYNYRCRNYIKRPGGAGHTPGLGRYLTGGIDVRKHTPFSSQLELSFDANPHFPDNLDAYAPWVARHGLRYPYGECQCGCGEKTGIAARANARYGNQVGQPKRFAGTHGTNPPQSRIKIDPIPGETWIDIAGFDGCYQVSSMGRVRSQRLGTWRLLRQTINARGRPKVNLYTPAEPGNAITREVHRLVLEAFVGPCPEGMEACHNDGDPLNNRADNLRWDTHAANLRDKRRHGTAGKLTLKQAREIRAKSKAGVAPKSLAAKYGITTGHVSNIVHRRAWQE